MEPIIDYIKTNPAEVGLIATAIFLALTGKWRDALALLMGLFKPKPEPVLSASTGVSPVVESDLDALLGMFKRELLSGDHAAQKATLAKIEVLCPCAEHKPVVEVAKP